MSKSVVWVGSWASAILAVAAFFLPWAHIDVSEPELIHQVRRTAQDQGLMDGLSKKIGRVAVTVKRGAETFTGELPSLSELPRQVSGVHIPQLANQRNSQVVIALVELFTNTRQHVGLKSYAVYLVPGLACVAALLLTRSRHRPVITAVVGLACAAIAGVGFWKLLTTNTRTLFVAITIGRGLWLSLWAYVGLAVAAGLSLVLRPRPAN